MSETVNLLGEARAALAAAKQQLADATSVAIRAHKAWKDVHADAVRLRAALQLAERVITPISISYPQLMPLGALNRIDKELAATAYLDERFFVGKKEGV